MRQQYPQAEIQLWAMDEQMPAATLRERIGLKPMLRRIWVPWWENPIAKVQWRYEWVWVYGFVHPASGETYWWIMPTVNIDLFNQVLADFAQHFGLGQNKHVLLSVDQAGWHTSDKVVLPEGLHLEFLPSDSPELQPAERLWSILDEPIATRTFETIEDLEQVLCGREAAPLEHRCCVLLKQREFIQGLTHFHWCQEANA